ncbi:MAG: hypothetical protein NZO16_06995, partial [Deltaproteobacteria bacterium]|nr:hypothetical protein [Deltaproteobacteria bacterium]
MNVEGGLKRDVFDEESDESLDEEALEETENNKSQEEAQDILEIERLQASGLFQEVDDDLNLDHVENLLEVPEDQLPKFTLAKNKARFLRMLSWYSQKEEWIVVAPLSGVTKLFKQQVKELEGIRAA